MERKMPCFSFRGWYSSLFSLGRPHCVSVIRISPARPRPICHQINSNQSLSVKSNIAIFSPLVCVLTVLHQPRSFNKEYVKHLNGLRFPEFNVNI